MTEPPVRMVTQVGIRLTPQDVDKLAALCGHTQRSMSDVVRLLIRLAQPVDLPHLPVRLSAGRQSEEAYVVST